ncbi:MAG: FAD-dependent oxidoreductase [Verrucomicrobia bacterium]|nr:FAD-dependent oxidoreductase [Verrucomicrobiota bacterium]MDA1067614.1 FAD-dependent oxidoreductase [Verrucomicrobiota bacterium]
MNPNHFDYLVIGGGSAGYAAARTAREVVDRVAIVDGSEHLGGLCILKGCMPSKTLIYSAEVLHHAKQGNLFGLNIPEAKVDMKALHQRKVDTIKEFSEYRVEGIESDRFTLFRNRAEFTGPNSVRLDDGRELTADKIMISTGSVVQVPPVPGLADLEGVWTSDDVLDLDFLPESVTVLGGGIVASELTQFLNRVGSKVIQIQRSEHILKEVSPEASTVIEKVFRNEGIELYTGTSIQSICKSDEGFEVTFEQNGEVITRTARHLFNALGRVPNTKNLNLEAVGVSLRKTGHIKTGPFNQTDNPNVYAAGDVAGPVEIVHVAIIQGEAAAKHATGRKVREPSDWDFLGVIFTDPQIAVAGKNEAMLKAEGIDFVSADYPWDDHGKSILMEAKHGFVRLFADRSGKILGAEIVGKDAGELIHAFSVAISLKASVVDLLNAPWYHPTLSEMVTYPLEEIAEELGLAY